MKLKVMSMLNSMKTMNRNIVPEVKFDNSMIGNIELKVNSNIVTFVNPQLCKPFGGKPIHNQGCVRDKSLCNSAASQQHFGN